MPVTTEQPDGDQKAPQDRWVHKQQAVEYMQNKGLDLFTYETLRHYSYETDLLPRPKVVGRHAYWRVADLERLLEQL
jgi:hypothetical protein